MSPAAGAAVPQAHGHHHSDSLRKLALGAIGVVYGDIGTSPLYAMKEVFVGHHPLAVDQLHIFGVVSLVFWSLVLIVTCKYVMTILRADNNGEGGSLALLALIQRRSGAGKRWEPGLVVLGVLATALFFGDCMITPAISVLSAVEGLATVEQRFDSFVIPISVTILIGLFYLQSVGTARVGRLFGPIMTIYFVTLSALGLYHVVAQPEILLALDPRWAFRFAAADGMLAFLALGSVVLAVTGAEALYADMGHFGRKPIAYAWLWFVFPALMLNYLGQGALMLSDPTAAKNPFFLMAPEQWRLPLVILATMATVIASQAVITGAYSVVQQAVQLGLMPRIRIEHTSASAAGQIYIPSINWALLTMVLLLILGFRESSNLAAAYGIAVTGTMFISTCMVAVLIQRVWHWPLWAVVPFVAVFLCIDGLYFSSNLTKVPDGGWFPLLVAIIVFVLLTTWATGRKLMLERMREGAMPIKVFIGSAAGSATRVPGTAVFMTSTPEGVPHALLHNLKHNRVLHERVILLTVKVSDMPYVAEESRFEHKALGEGFHRVILRYGFMESPDIPAALKSFDECGGEFRMMETSFFLSRQTLLPSARPGMAIWREKLFAWMLRNAESAMEFFRLPTNRVVELGSQIEI
ncbi:MULTISPECIES: potassium transporter Kup [Sphingomonas]|jgi:KUP system potassium uptake protein|uniref:Probable potassium transport system protein Kup n=1 Tax=Sphingomonas olei TaxID=1886787 RepID=A0ABY2QDI8_9SPHN|nr:MULTISPECIES: potassium transporter Kup [Sphingomonas]MDF2602758.1 trkD [Sphingomonas sp.]THG37777.1 potassium transporter Kup [Sphingomonas olei]